MKNWDKWDKGEHTYSDAEEKLMTLKRGEKIGNVLAECTICPIGNATCAEFFNITVAGFHPEKGIEEQKITICPLGVAGDGEDCPLNK